MRPCSAVVYLLGAAGQVLVLELLLMRSQRAAVLQQELIGIHREAPQTHGLAW